MPGAETASAWLWCSEALSISRLAAAMSSRQLTRCTLLMRLDIMVSVKLLYSHETIWCWLPHGCADQLVASYASQDAVHCRIQLQRVQLQQATMTTAPRSESSSTRYRVSVSISIDVMAGIVLTLPRSVQQKLMNSSKVDGQWRAVVRGVVRLSELWNGWADGGSTDCGSLSVTTSSKCRNPRAVCCVTVVAAWLPTTSVTAAEVSCTTKPTAQIEPKSRYARFWLGLNTGKCTRLWSQRLSTFELLRAILARAYKLPSSGTENSEG